MRTPFDQVFHYGQLPCALLHANFDDLADKAVQLKIGDMLLSATVTRRAPDWLKPDGLALRVDYYECNAGASGLPPVNTRRESGMTPRESGIAHTVYRAIQHCFDPHCRDEIQIVINIVSLDPGCDAELGALLVTSAVLRLSDLPVIATLGAARVALSKGRFTLNPSSDIRGQADLTVLASGTAQTLTMVNAQAAEMPEDVVIDAIAFAHLQMQACIKEIEAFAEQALPVATAKQALASFDRYPLWRAVEAMRTTARSRDAAYARIAAAKAFDAQLVRTRLLGGQLRTDGRHALHLLPSSTCFGLLPEAHGSALVSQSQNQTLCSVTLGDASVPPQLSSSLNRSRERFLVHVQMPTLDAREVERDRMLEHRDWQLAAFIKNALAAVLPTKSVYPRTCRLAVEVRESSDPIPMHSVCAASLALQNAGVPLRHPVVGISAGALHNRQRNYVLLDAIGPELLALDAQARMAGTAVGVTALQLDLRSPTPLTVLHELLARARDARQDLAAHLAMPSRPPFSSPGAETDASAPMNRSPVGLHGDPNAH